MRVFPRHAAVRFLLAAALGLLVTACSLGAISREAGKKYLIVDQATGRTLTAITLAPGSDRPERIVSYGPDQTIIKEQRLGYDSKGQLIAREVSLTLPGGGVTTSKTTYSYRDVKDPAGRLRETIQTASTGKIVTTYYGYDSTGTPRGVVVQSGNSLVMKDYPN